ncbi:GAF domain-containing sensor histidine kinase [Tumebacillus sp. BK434]|uniref:GAF domain-containing sensor histidine kinase n=1 Tax=Tumebacillus sp. BK434 TaxID=2512169 RepID=UPI00104E4AC9|nr:GAF domain-containing sensor histidine kinase [Tumebacillus sp. BK434]
MNITFSFPLLYAMVLNTGFEATALCSAAILLVVNTLRRRPWKARLTSVFGRVAAILGAGMTVNLLWPLLPGEPAELLFEEVRMTLMLVVFLFLSFAVFVWNTDFRALQQPFRPLILKLVLLDLVVSFLYTGLMMYLGIKMPVTNLGMLGFLFYFLPLAAACFLLYLFNNLNRAKQGLVTLFEVSRTISQQHSLPTVLEQVIDRAADLVGGHCGVLYLLEDGELRSKVCTCSSDQSPQKLPKGISIAWAVASSGKAELVHDVERDTRFWPGETQYGTRTLLVVPIIIADKVAGVISLGRNEPHSFLAAELQLMEIFASHAAVAMKNALYIVEREKRLLVEERNRLAREIHDGIAQDLASAVFQLEMLRRGAADEAANEQMRKLQDMLRQTATTLRNSIFSLRPAPYTHAGLRLAMKVHLDEMEKAHGLPFEFDAPEQLLQLAPDVMSVVYQVFAESVQNALKHAAATRLQVKLLVDEDCLQLTVRDNGKGFHFGRAMLEAVNRHSFGIENLHLLADQAGGTLEYHTAPGKGTEIVLEIPLKEDGTDDGTRGALR